MNDRLKGVQLEVDEMSKILDGEPLGTSAPATSAPATSSPATSAPATSAPATSAPATTAPATEVPEDDELKREREENERLRAKIEEMSGPKKTTPATTAPATEAPLEDVDFVGEVDDEDDIRLTKEDLNKFLNKVRKDAISVASDRDKQLSASIPGQIRVTSEVINELKAAKDKFFEENEDLAKFPKVVASVFGDLMEGNEKKTYSELLTETAKEARSRLGLPEPSKGKKKDDTDPPPLPRRKGSKDRSKGSEPKLSAIEAEIAEMDKVLNE